MAYHLEDKDLVINGFENGIADSPYGQSTTGVTGTIQHNGGVGDMRNVNIVSIPSEASVNFSTVANSYPRIANGNVTSANAGADTITFDLQTTLENGMSVVFAGGSLPAGITAGTIYWVSNVSASTSCKLYTDQGLASLVDITSNGTGTFITFDMAKPMHMTFATTGSFYFLVDASGYVWGTNRTTTSGYWTFTGNTTVANANGNGLQYFQDANGTGWLFVFRNKRIDYTPTAAIGWIYGWQPTTGAAGGDSLVTGAGTNNSHMAIVGQTNVNTMYWCDANYVGSLLQTAIGTPFDPTTPATYTYSQKALGIPTNDISQSLVILGTNLLVGGQRNLIYQWDRTSTGFNPIFISENFISKMVTVNTNSYIFAGNRGRIYVTNGTQAQLYKKIPDFLSGTVEPYFTWGGATSVKNQLYFGVQATTNAGGANNNYGGLWAIDLDTGATRLTNQLSYASYAGIANVVIPIFGTPGTPAGTGLYIGWDSGSSTYGVDTTSSTPYTGGQAYVNTELIPVGTALNPRTLYQVEFKLAVPIVTGESVQLQWRQKLSDAFTPMKDAAGALALYNTTGIFSGACQGVNFEKSQWIQIQAVLTSTASSPSYVRLTEIRIR